MTHSPAAVEEALRLAAMDHSVRYIAAQLGVPRRTIVDWLAGRAPRTPTPAPDHALLPAAYLYLFGLYLGDGCIASHPRGVYRLRITLDAKYPGIVADCERAMREVLPGNAVALLPRPYGDVEVSSYSKHWPHLFPQHGPGKKHLRAIDLADWQERAIARHPRLLLRGLIHSDGCRFENTGSGGWRHPRYSFFNYSADIRRIFCDACDLLELRWTTSAHTIYVSRKADVARLDEFIGPKR